MKKYDQGRIKVVWGPWLKLRKGPYSGVRRKFSWGVHSVACGAYLLVVCGVCDVTIWRHIHVSKPTFWRSLL